MVNTTLRPLYRRERDPVPIVQEAGWEPEPVRADAENLAATAIRSPNRPVRSESLYRLSHPGPYFVIKYKRFVVIFLTHINYPQLSMSTGQARNDDELVMSKRLHCMAVRNKQLQCVSSVGACRVCLSVYRLMPPKQLQLRPN